MKIIKLENFLNPNNDIRYYTNKADDYKNPKQIGYATNYILGKNAPFILDVDLDEFVKNSMNTMFKTDSLSKINTVNIVIDSFRVDNKSDLLMNHAKYTSNLKYNFKASNGKQYSFKSVYNKTRTHFDENNDALRNLVYEGLTGTAKEFLNFYDNQNSDNYKKNILNDTIFVESLTKGYNDHESSFLIDFYTGSKIKSSYSLAYSYDLLPQDSRLSHNFDIKYTYLKLKDQDNYKDVRFSLINLGYSLRQFFNSERDKLFISCGVDVTLSRENFNNSKNENNSKTIYGTVIEANLGYKLGIIVLKAGIDDMILFNSDILNSCNWLNFGISVQM